jgi:RimJ/RimL family protein N-acetyltransferase
MHPTLVTDGIIVRPLAAGDVESLHAAVLESREAVGRWMSWCQPDYAARDAEGWIAHCRRNWDAGLDREFGIFDASSGEVLGCAGINQFNRVNNFANLGYWVRTSRVGRGVASNAVLMLARFAFGELKLTRIEIVAQVDNVASRRVAEKAGCRFEGIARNRILYRGQPRHAALYSLVPGDIDDQGDDR